MGFVDLQDPDRWDPVTKAHRPHGVVPVAEHQVRALAPPGGEYRAPQPTYGPVHESYDGPRAATEGAAGLDLTKVATNRLTTPERDAQFRSRARRRRTRADRLDLSPGRPIGHPRQRALGTDPRETCMQPGGASIPSGRRHGSDGSPDSRHIRTLPPVL